jgi:hypothetical protein
MKVLGEEEYSSYSLSTSALDGGEWSVSRLGHALPPGKGPPVPIVQEAGWAPEPVYTQRLVEKSPVSAGDRNSIARRPARSQTLHCLSYPAHKTSDNEHFCPQSSQVTDRQLIYYAFSLSLSICPVQCRKNMSTMKYTTTASFHSPLTNIHPEDGNSMFLQNVFVFFPAALHSASIHNTTI